MFFSPNERHIIQEVKEKICYVSLDFKAEKDSLEKEKSFTLPDN